MDGNPVQEARQLRLQGLLAWQAERLLQDHWFDLDPSRPPYYRRAGLLYVSDARRLDPRRGSPQEALQALQERLEQPGDLVLAVPPAALEAGIAVQGCHTVAAGTFKLRTTNASAGAIRINVSPNSMRAASKRQGAWPALQRTRSVPASTGVHRCQWVPWWRQSATRSGVSQTTVTGRAVHTRPCTVSR